MGVHNPVALIVDYDQHTRNRIRTMLRSQRCSVLEAATLREALWTMSEPRGAIDLVVVNHKLNGGFGEQAIHLLKKALPRARILHYCTYPPLGALERGGAAQGVVFIPAPFSRASSWQRCAN